jgi:hypothetical protein
MKAKRRPRDEKKTEKKKKRGEEKSQDVGPWLILWGKVWAMVS